MKRKKRIHITSISIFMLVMTLFTAAFSMFGLKSLYNNYNDMLQETESYITCQKDISKIQTTSAYLTEQCRQYVLTGDSTYMHSYFIEVNKNKNREYALEEIKKEIQDEERDTIIRIEHAISDSNELMNTEIHAMKLISLVERCPRDELPEKVLNYTLPEEEAGLLSVDMKEKAHDLVFDSTYTLSKARIENNLQKGVEDLIDYMQDKQMESRMKMQMSLFYQIICFAVLVIVILIVFVLIYLMVIRTIAKFAESIEAGEKMDVRRGSAEFQYLAKAYNRLADETYSQQEKLQYQAEHDALTGLLNRNAMSSLIDCMEIGEKKIALLIVDVDKFKEVNDNYGHKEGDKTLKYIAKQLSKLFRPEDYIFRYGGDEFVVILKDIDGTQKSFISEKIDYLNEKLRKKQQEKDFKCSISVGIAFSENGYSDKIFKQADEALYEVKENGRCGFRFYN